MGRCFSRDGVSLREGKLCCETPKWQMDPFVHALGNLRLCDLLAWFPAIFLPPEQSWYMHHHHWANMKQLCTREPCCLWDETSTTYFRAILLQQVSICKSYIASSMASIEVYYVYISTHDVPFGQISESQRVMQHRSNRKKKPDTLLHETTKPRLFDCVAYRINVAMCSSSVSHCSGRYLDSIKPHLRILHRSGNLHVVPILKLGS